MRNGIKIVYSAKLLLRATANEITILWESKTLFLMVLPDLMLHKHAVASEEKERELPTTWNHLLLRGLSCIFVYNLVHLKYCVHFCCHLHDLSYFFSLSICNFIIILPVMGQKQKQIMFVVRVDSHTGGLPSPSTALIHTFFFQFTVYGRPFI